MCGDIPEWELCSSAWEAGSWCEGGCCPPTLPRFCQFGNSAGTGSQILATFDFCTGDG